MNTFKLARIQAKLRFIDRFGPAAAPSEINKLWHWREELASLTVRELEAMDLSVSSLSIVMFQLEQHIDYMTCMVGER